MVRRRRFLGGARARPWRPLHHLAVDEDAPAVGVDAVGGEGGHLPPAQARVGHGQDLQLPPPHAPLPRRRGQGVHGRGGGDVGLVHEPALLLGVEAVALGRRQCTPRSRSWEASRRPSSSPAATMAVRQRRRCEATGVVGAASSNLSKWRRLSWRAPLPYAVAR